MTAKDPRARVRGYLLAQAEKTTSPRSGLGIETVLTPIHTPQANGVVERLIGTLRRECADHINPLNEQHLRQVLREYVVYYDDTRPHRTLALEPPEGAHTPQRFGPVIASPILGGLHHRYERKAA